MRQAFGSGRGEGSEAGVPGSASGVPGSASGVPAVPGSVREEETP